MTEQFPDENELQTDATAEQELGPEYLTRADIEAAINHTQFQEPEFGMEPDRTDIARTHTWERRMRILDIAHEVAAEGQLNPDDAEEISAGRLEAMILNIDAMRGNDALFGGIGDGTQRLTPLDVVFLRRLQANLDDAALDPRAARARFAEMEAMADAAHERRYNAQRAAQTGTETVDEGAESDEEADREAMLAKARESLANVHTSGELSRPRLPRHNANTHPGTDADGMEGAAVAAAKAKLDHVNISSVRSASRAEAGPVQGDQKTDLPPELQAVVDRIRSGAITREQYENLAAEQNELVPSIHAGDQAASDRYRELGKVRSAGSFATREPAELYKVMEALGFDQEEIGQVAAGIHADAAKHPGRPAQIGISFGRTDTGQLQYGLIGYSR